MGDPKAIAAAAAAAATAARSSTGGGSRPGTGASGRVEVEGAPESDTDSSSYSAEDRGRRSKTPTRFVGALLQNLQILLSPPLNRDPTCNDLNQPTNPPTDRRTNSVSRHMAGGRVGRVAGARARQSAPGDGGIM